MNAELPLCRGGWKCPLFCIASLCLGWRRAEAWTNVCAGACWNQGGKIQDAAEVMLSQQSRANKYTKLSSFSIYLLYTDNRERVAVSAVWLQARCSAEALSLGLFSKQNMPHHFRLVPCYLWAQESGSLEHTLRRYLLNVVPSWTGPSTNPVHFLGNCADANHWTAMVS